MRGRTKDSLENFSIQDIVENEKTKADITEELAGLKEMLTVLKQYNADLKKVELNIANARSCYEDTVRWAKEQKDKVEEQYNKIVEKFVVLDKHLDLVIQNAPSLLRVKVAIPEADKSAIQAQFDGNVHKMREQHQKDMAEIRQAFDAQMTKEYEHSNKFYKEVHNMLRQSDGFYISGFWFWVYATFFWFGVLVGIGWVAIGIYKTFVS